MATFKNGVNGSFSGRVGNVIGYQWRGINVMRALPRKSNKPRSEKQLANEMRMKLAMSFLSPLSGLIAVGYQQAADGLPMTPFNIALSYHKKHAIGGEYPDLYFDYSKAIISTGALTPAEALAAEWTDEGLAVSWHASPQDGNLVNSQNTTIIWCLATNEKWDIRTSGITRGMGRYLFPLPQDVIGADVHVYLAFNKALSSEMSESRHVQVQANS
ncbi:hypothetical protein GCM10007415_37590 [Parapedobacter pyrenivorans]|uniref:Uncharacterized protein n=1 Tax=Parapedobacter pyrenivorans TaxID=1305674 RepID=A0A917HZS7_9SPHI|nr:DUF6266 family protein [Parapedobacter pyrenivorans]GGG98485.1 hypothetical protein GCM10007415_37590 [Parapedobacter pyrenivorans]